MGCGASLPLPANFELTAKEEDIALRYQLSTTQMGNLVYCFNEIAQGDWKATKDLAVQPKRKSRIEQKNVDAVPTADFHGYFGTEVDTLYHRHLFEIIGESASSGSLNRLDFLQSVALISSLNVHMITDYCFNAFDHVDGDKGINQSVFAKQLADLEAHSPTRMESGKVLTFVKELNLPRDAPIDSASFHEMAEAVPHLVAPALRLQEAIRKKTLGVSTWIKLTEQPRATSGPSALMGAATAIDTRKKKFRPQTKYLVEEDPEEAKRRAKEEQKERMKRAASKSKMRRAQSKQDVHGNSNGNGGNGNNNHNTTTTSAPTSPEYGYHHMDEKKHATNNNNTNNNNNNNNNARTVLPGAIVDNDSPPPHHAHAGTLSSKSKRATKESTTVSTSSAPDLTTREKLLAAADAAQNEADQALLEDDQQRSDAAQQRADSLRTQAARIK